jgi:6-phosphogluconolactonase (cycloisomerase 2 family)
MLPPAVVAKPGTGPRHLRHSADGALLLVGELSATLGWYRPGPDGSLALEGEVLTSGAEGVNFPSEIVTGRDGRFVYVANRGPDMVSVFSWDGDQATLVEEVPTGGEWPRHMTLLGDHLYVANQMSQSVTTFRVDRQSGRPVPVGEPSAEPSPTCLLRWTPLFAE